MTISHERSFLAWIRCEDEKIIFFDDHPYGQGFNKVKSVITTANGFDSYGIGPTWAYFIGHDDYTYTIQFRGGKKNHGKYLCRADRDNPALGAFPDPDRAASFLLYDTDLNVITVQDMLTSNKNVYLRLNDGPFIKKQFFDNKMYTFSKLWGSLATFNLHIARRGWDDIENYGLDKPTGEYLILHKPSGTYVRVDEGR